MKQHHRRAERAPLAAALDRVLVLRSAYKHAVRRLIVGEAGVDLEQDVNPVDAADAHASAALSAWRSGHASEREVIDAHDALAGLMVRVIRRSSRSGRHGS
jgi:hypothetical protein